MHILNSRLPTANDKVACNLETHRVENHKNYFDRNYCDQSEHEQRFENVDRTYFAFCDYKI